MKNPDGLEIGISMATLKIASEDARRDEEILQERKKRREELLAKEPPKRVVSWFWSRFWGWRKA